MKDAASLRPRAANFVALTPLSFLDCTAEIYPSRLVAIEDERRFTRRESRQRCVTLFSLSLGRSSGNPKLRHRKGRAK
jgi:fatty-acyl-CoA synthase